MDDRFEWKAADQAHLAHTVSRWLTRAGAPDAGLGADLVDIAAAGVQIASLLEQLVKLDHSDARQMDEALDILVRLEIYLFQEARHHLDQLQPHWGAVHQAVSSLAPDDE